MSSPIRKVILFLAILFCAALVIAFDWFIDHIDSQDVTAVPSITDSDVTSVTSESSDEPTVLCLLNCDGKGKHDHANH